MTLEWSAYFSVYTLQVDETAVACDKILDGLSTPRFEKYSSMSSRFEKFVMFYSLARAAMLDAVSSCEIKKTVGGYKHKTGKDKPPAKLYNNDRVQSCEISETIRLTIRREHRRGNKLVTLGTFIK